MSEKVHWSKLRVLLIELDGSITGPAGLLDTRIALDDFYRGIRPEGCLRRLGRCGLPHETDDEKTWGPKSRDEVDWEGFEQASQNVWEAVRVDAFHDDPEHALRGARLHIDADAILEALDEHGIDGIEWHLVPKPKASAG